MKHVLAFVISLTAVSMSGQYFVAKVGYFTMNPKETFIDFPELEDYDTYWDEYDITGSGGPQIALGLTTWGAADGMTQDMGICISPYKYKLKFTQKAGDESNDHSIDVTTITPSLYFEYYFNFDLFEIGLGANIGRAAVKFDYTTEVIQRVENNWGNIEEELVNANIKAKFSGIRYNVGIYARYFFNDEETLCANAAVLFNMDDMRIRQYSIDGNEAEMSSGMMESLETSGTMFNFGISYLFGDF